MKKIILAVLFMGSVCYGAQPHSMGSISVSKQAFSLNTLAQINALTPDTTGQVVLCIDCAQSAVCISSGSNTPNSVGAFVVIANTGTFVGSTFSGFAHCK